MGEIIRWEEPVGSFQRFSKSARASGWGVGLFTQGCGLTFGPFESLEHTNTLLSLASGPARCMTEVAEVYARSEPYSEMCSLAAESRAIACEPSVFTAALIALADLTKHMHGPSEPAQGS